MCASCVRSSSRGRRWRRATRLTSTCAPSPARLPNWSRCVVSVSASMTTMTRRAAAGSGSSSQRASVAVGDGGGRRVRRQRRAARRQQCARGGAQRRAAGCDNDGGGWWWRWRADRSKQNARAASAARRQRSGRERTTTAAAAVMKRRRAHSRCCRCMPRARWCSNWAWCRRAENTTLRNISIRCDDDDDDDDNDDDDVAQIGFRSVRELPSYLDPKREKLMQYVSTIIDGGDAPLYRVTPVDDPGAQVTHSASSGAWRAMMTKIKDRSNVRHVDARRWCRGDRCHTA